MDTAIALNGSPRMEKGNTAGILDSFIRGMTEAGCAVELFNVDRLDVRPCTGELRCWHSQPGECYIHDDMDRLYPKLRAARILILAAPVYIPLPGGFQNVLNRLCPLLDPVLEIREQRTRGRFREGVEITKLVLVSTCGWWEMGNFGTVVRIAEELAKDAGIVFSGAVLRPHAFMMRRQGELTEDGREVLGAAQDAGRELVADGEMRESTLARISRPLIKYEELIRLLNGEG
jgi:multimeric flavodoxin WrbA